MIYFLDSSALVKRYVREAGSVTVAGLFRRRAKLAASGLAIVEVPAALFRRARAGDLAMGAAQAHAADVARDLDQMYVVEARKAVLDSAHDLVERHPLRAYDAVQLASALRIVQSTEASVTFVCADRGLAGAAIAESLRTLRV
ncbi:MAG: type II toxin-antitoxin system VapC family toxin [Polyangiaceae bacterium]